jgi:hypothetical protein
VQLPSNVITRKDGRLQLLYQSAGNFTYTSSAAPE